MGVEGPSKKRRARERRYLEAVTATDFHDSGAVAKLRELYRNLFGSTNGVDLDNGKPKSTTSSSKIER